MLTHSKSLTKNYKFKVSHYLNLNKEAYGDQKFSDFIFQKSASNFVNLLRKIFPFGNSSSVA